MIVAFTGNIGSGKSSLANMLVERNGFIEYSFAGPIKEIGKIFGFTEQEMYGTQNDKLKENKFWGVSFRTFAQKLGTELFRVRLAELIPEMKECWLRLCEKFLEENMDKNIVISDLRFLDEAKMLKGKNCIIFKTFRGCDDSTGSRKHASELEISKIESNCDIDNQNYSLEENYELVRNTLGLE
jgi:hypothetical protein